MARPFHETVVDTITRVNAIWDEAQKQSALAALAWLIQDTVIPKNHDAIAARLTEAAGEWTSDIEKALAHLENEKARCEEASINEFLKLADKAFENLSKT